MSGIREITPGEAGLLLPLLRQVQDLHVDAHPDIFRADASEDDRQAFLHAFLSQPDVTALALLSEAGTAVGYAIYEIQSRGPSVLKSARRIGFLHQIAVDEKNRRQGIARRLIAEMKTRLRSVGVSRFGSEYFAFNSASNALMKDAGLHPIRISAEGQL